jgi:1,4-dihydroxy-2-naphthoyl-CoA hydrolase
VTEPSYQYRITIPFQDIDAAGIVFFAHLFRYAHEAYEHFMSDQGHSLADILRNGDFLLPVVHAEADYRRPLRHNESVIIEVSVKQLGDSSFTLEYHCLDTAGELRAELQTVHVALDATSRKPIAIPAALCASLTRP